MEEQYHEILQIFSVNAENLVFSQSELGSQNELLTSRSYLNEAIEEENQKENDGKSNNLKTSITSSHDLTVDLNYFLK